MIQWFLEVTFFSFKGCGCSTSGSISAICDENSGRCTCRPNYTGFQCNRCKEGYYGFPNCLPCDCNSEGSLEGRLNNCDTVDGQCFCKPTYSGLKCDRCLPGFYGFPDCKQCNCNPAGTKPGPGGQPGDCSTNNNVSEEGCPSRGEHVPSLIWLIWVCCSDFEKSFKPTVFSEAAVRRCSSK